MLCASALLWGRVLKTKANFHHLSLSSAGVSTPIECCFSYCKSPLRLKGGWRGHKRDYSCHFSPSFTFHLGRFETRNGAKICTNPEEFWVKRAVEKFQKKKELPAP
uniref:Chemokine interleukin-8-like domain-containing protein n=1 Tax=Calidris pygmaea TaxID=425635 RepID=A0A8C3KQL3_9CHAR